MGICQSKNKEKTYDNVVSVLSFHLKQKCWSDCALMNKDFSFLFELLTINHTFINSNLIHPDQQFKWFYVGFIEGYSKQEIRGR